MNALQLILLGLVAGVAAGLAVLTAAALFVPFARARRAGLAAFIGGSIGFTLTALTQGPFYHDAKDMAALAQPLGLAALVAAGAAGLCAAMILRAGGGQP
jgi:hypothetical protein